MIGVFSLIFRDCNCSIVFKKTRFIFLSSVSEEENSLSYFYGKILRLGFQKGNKKFCASVFFYERCIFLFFPFWGKKLKLYLYSLFTRKKLDEK